MMTFSICCMFEVDVAGIRVLLMLRMGLLVQAMIVVASAMQVRSFMIFVVIFFSFLGYE